MTDINENPAEEHQYLLHAVWCVTDHHDQEQYCHRVIHSIWEGEWDAKGIVERYVLAEHPDWMPARHGNIGYVQGSARLTGVTVYKVSSRDEKAWEKWLKEAKAAREVVNIKREREADMLTIRALQAKWNLNAEKQECQEENPASEAEEAAKEPV